MAATQLTDLIIPSVFTPYAQVRSAELNAFIQSGVVVQSDIMTQLLSGGAQTFNFPFFKDLVQTEANISSDAPGTNATPLNITTGQQVVIRHSRNQVWSSMDLNEALSGEDPLDAIASLVGSYWAKQEQKMLITSLQGLFADNAANDGADMRVDISLGGAGAPGSANFFSAEAFIDAQQTMGDAQSGLAAVAMHSVVFTRAKKNNLIDFIPDARGEVDIPTFLGLRVVVDDGLPAVSFSGNVRYSTYLFGLGSVARGDGVPRVATETDRLPLTGNGGGQEFLFNRTEFALHPVGFAWLSASMAGKSPTNAELANAANWDRRYPERKQIRLAELRTNG